MSLWLNCYQINPYHKNTATSLFVIAKRALKALILDYSPVKINCGLVNNNFIELIPLIDFLNIAHILPKQDFTPIGVIVANKNQKRNKLLCFFQSCIELILMLKIICGKKSKITAGYCSCWCFVPVSSLSSSPRIYCRTIQGDFAHRRNYVCCLPQNEKFGDQENEAVSPPMIDEVYDGTDILHVRVYCLYSKVASRVYVTAFHTTKTNSKTLYSAMDWL